MNYLRELVIKKVKMLETANTIEELEDLKKYRLIEELLKDDACFFKINSSIAYSILIELDIDNPLDYYKNLISYKEYLKNKESFNLKHKKHLPLLEFMIQYICICFADVV